MLKIAERQFLRQPLTFDRITFDFTNWPLVYVKLSLTFHTPRYTQRYKTAIIGLPLNDQCTNRKTTFQSNRSQVVSPEM